ncbi:AraC family transcriptional regulator [Paenibacillus flagellatus]|uniref:AraC family transcriptional regulator n=1 Tax=Paenibacillus flagellatus TaxID=2211139 RepID=A0A2V5K6T7_9BACL|nr:AraC family transcriptional regulator [Paenibacillus flagellatus]PYI53513.1 AraC family transcriptional regulator [Paenibacillus flagellatus]
MRRFVDTTSERLFLSPERPIFVNRVSESFELAEHTHEFVEINYVSEGNGYQHISGQTVPVEKGDLFYLPIGVSHVFRPASRTPSRSRLIVYNCLFNASFARMLGSSFPLRDEMTRFLLSPYPEQPWYHWKDREGRFQAMFETLHEEFARKQADYLLLMQAEVVRMLVLMRRRLLPVPCSEEPVRPDDPFEGALADVRGRAAEPLRVSELAASAGLSERQFRRRFRERTGMGFTEFVQKARIERSCELLRTTDGKVEAIARTVGYEDVKFFNRLFKGRTGLTPGQYRRKSREAGPSAEHSS